MRCASETCPLRTMKAASRMGTAPLSPPQTTKSRSPQRARDQREQQRQHDPVSPDVLAGERAELDREAERDEDDDLREAGERGVKAFDLGLVGRADVADQD